MAALRLCNNKVGRFNYANNGGNFYTVTFYQSARFYKLFVKNKNCAKALTALKYSKKNNIEVLVFLTENFGDIIYDVKKNKK
jgi:hypothetical protein